jgi:hypothetical protein
MRRSKPVVVSDLLALFLKETGLEKSYREYQILKIWDEILGKSISSLTIYKRIEGRKLYIQLSSSVARDELFMMRSEIVREFNRRAGEMIIDEIILK